MSAPNTITLPPKDREREIERVISTARLIHPGKAVNVRFTIARPERSIPELRYLHGVPYKMLSEAMGFEPDEISEYLCGCFWGWKSKKLPGGRVTESPIRTTTKDAEGNRDVISGEEFWRYVNWIQRVGARHGIIIPDPEKEYGVEKR